MRTIIICLLLSISFSSFGQIKTQQELLPDNYFSEQLKSQRIPDSFKISPEFQKEIPSLKFDFSYPLPEKQENEMKTERRFLNDNTTYFSSRMPVLQGDFYSNMPIAVPDSSVHYFIQNKKIEMVNPLFKSDYQDNDNSK